MCPRRTARASLVFKCDLRYSLCSFDQKPLENMLVDINRRLKRSKAFDQGRVQGRLVAALDGIEVLSSFSRRCEYCLERRVSLKENGHKVEQIQYYHRAVGCQMIHGPVKAFLGVEWLQPGEGEETAALRLLRRLPNLYGSRFFDILLLDALYAQTPVLHLMRPAQGQRRLPHPCGPGDRQDHRLSGRSPRIQPPGQRPQFPLPAGEVRRSRRQLPGHHASGGVSQVRLAAVPPPRQGLQASVNGQDRLIRPGPRVDAHLVVAGGCRPAGAVPAAGPSRRIRGLEWPRAPDPRVLARAGRRGGLAAAR